MESFAPWLERLESAMTERALDEASREIPPTWYDDDYDALLRLLEQLHGRRSRVPELILEAKRTHRQPFPNWMRTMTETSAVQQEQERGNAEKSCAYRILRYTPNLVRDEWVNIGVLLFDPQTGERRLRMIEEEDEFRRLRRLHPAADELLLRAIRDDLEDRFQSASVNGGKGHAGDWRQLLAKWDETLSNALQLAPQKGVFVSDLDAELERLYGDHVARQRSASRVGAPGSRAVVRSYCSQVFRQARLWERLEKSVRAEQFTFPGDPMRRITVTVATARADSCTCSPSPARQPTPSFLLTPRSASPPKLR